MSMGRQGRIFCSFVQQAMYHLTPLRFPMTAFATVFTLPSAAFSKAKHQQAQASRAAW